MIALAILIAAVVGFIVGAVYYALAPSVQAYSADDPPARPAPLLMLVELLRSAAIAALLAGLMSFGRFAGPIEGALLGLALWIVPVVLLAGAVFHEGTSLRSAALHAGDWLVKLVVIGAVIGAFA